MNDYVIVTPAKNEEQNIPRLVQTVAKQTLLPIAWILVNDKSTDNTVEVFNKEINKYDSLINVKIYVIENQTTDMTYGLGKKYSSVVKFGFDFLNGLKDFEYYFIALLDSDVFPESNYYEFLIKKLLENKKLGIVSGGTQIEIETKKKLSFSKTHAAGMMRVWRKECLKQTGYYPSISQDAVSEARAIMMGWKVRSYKEKYAYMRKVGGNSKYEYYGKSNYIRWVPYTVTLLHCIKLRFHGKRNEAFLFMKGYKEAKKEKLERLDDPLAKKFFRLRILYKIIGK